jgi:glyceraldehyde 3-phosphate dehydrogenase
MGVNEDRFDPEEHVVLSNASCTTNCLAPVAKVLDESFGIETGFLTTVHAYTSSQAIVDAPSKKWRRGRAGAVSIVPTTTGAAIATTKVLPQLEGKIDGLAMRVPVPDGSIIDFVAHTEQPLSVDSVNNAFRRAAQSDRLRGILGITDEELVSADIIGSTFSALVDGQSTMVVGDHTVKVLAWYDNEWGYARRVLDLAAYISDRI